MLSGLRKLSLIFKAVNDASYAAGKVLKTRLASIENPIERYLSANSSNWSTNLDDSKQTKIIGELKKFGGEVRTNVTIPIDEFYSSKERKALNLPDSIQVNKMLLFVMESIKAIRISITGTRVTAAKVEALPSLEINNTTLFRVAETGKSLRTNEALFWAQKYQSFQYIQFKPDSGGAPTMLEPNASVEDKKLYKIRVKNFYMRKVYTKVFTKILHKYSIEAGSWDKNEFDSFIKTSNIEGDAAILVKDSQDSSSYFVKIKSAKERENEELKQLKKEKTVLPYKFVVTTPTYTPEGLLTVNNYETVCYLRTSSIKTADLQEIDNIVYYASNKDKALLIVAAYIIATNARGKRNYIGDLNGGKDVSFLSISEDNKKFFKQIPNSMDVKEFFKAEHKIENNELYLQGGDNIRKYLTSYRLQKAMLSNPEFLVLAKDDTSVISKFQSMLGEEVEDIAFISTMRKVLRTFNVNRRDIDEGSLDVLITDHFSNVLSLEEDSLKGLFEMLNNMTKLQDVPDIEDFEEGDLKTQVAKFKSYTVNFYDKSFVNNAIMFMNKYSKLLLYSSTLVAIKESDHFNTKAAEAASREVLNQITEFFNNLNG